jgi:subtilisin family serine protease
VLAERLGFFGYCVTIGKDTSLSALNISSIIKSVEPIGFLTVAELGITMPSEKDVDQTLSPFRKNRMTKSEVSLDSFYTTETDARCVYDAHTVEDMMQPPSNADTIYNSSHPVLVYVLDTGIHSSHRQLHSSVDHGYDFENRTVISPDGMIVRDPHGHGTQVAGLLHQVCSNTRLVDVRVLDEDGVGRIDDIIKGLEYAVDHYFQNSADKGRLHSVINLSFSGEISPFLKNVLYFVSKILLVVGASGDDDTFSCNASPSSSEFILTVGAATWASALPLTGTNYGSCVKVRVAAEGIVTPYIGESNTEVREISGSSAATAFLSGLAAKVISILHTTPRGMAAIYNRYPNLLKQRSMVEFMTDLLTLPNSHQTRVTHSVYAPSCTTVSISHITDSLVQLLQLNVEPEVIDTGARRAIQNMKNRFKNMQRQKLESIYD